MRRLPGIRFDVVPPALAEALPRMDIAVFVGFASTGPLHVPVPIESVPEYDNVFGPDAPLAWDCAKGERIHAHLGPTVRAFFSNGGRRCWVIRVAMSAALQSLRDERGLAPVPGAATGGATYNRFALPGMLAATRGENGGWDVAPAMAFARCEGSWSDDLQVQTALQERPIRIEGFHPRADRTLAFSTQAAVVPGDVVRFDGHGMRAFARVDSVEIKAGRHEVALERPAVFDAMASPPGGSRDEWPVSSPGAAFETAALLTFDLTVKRASQAALTLTALGLARGHPNDWNARLDDHEVFTAARERPAAAQRFPLAAFKGSRDQHRWLIPIAVGADFGDPARAIPQAASAFERDGLAAYDPAIFLDPELEPWDERGLAPIAPAVLAEHADFLRYASPSPRRLFGIHAALGFDSGISEEATLIAVPDCVHAGWEKAADPKPGAEPFPRFSSEPVDGRFAACDIRPVPAPRFSAEPNPENRPDYRLEWDHVAPEATYRLEESRSRDYSDAHEIHSGSDALIEIGGRGPGRYFYRVKAVVSGEPGDWSHGIAVDVRDGAWAMRPFDGFAGDERQRRLLDFHGALLRLCAAKGEMFAILSPPAHYSARDAVAFAEELKNAAHATRSDTFGALYHPWPVDRRPNGTYYGFPPDGPVMGVLAARAFTRGAWIAPANEVMKDFVALSPALRLESWPALLDAQVNVLRQDPRGFLLMSEDTLSGDADLRPICVRRLLILLRRLALRRGANYVFEPNGDVLRRLVQRAFHEMLSELFERGAFAGRTPAQSFRVVTDETINTRQSMDAGRFFVDLKVAPSLPMTFLTVRLRQVGERLTVSEGR